jgi:hypothetical protein
MFGARIKLDRAFYDRVEKCAAAVGYASVEEFVRHALEKEMARLEKEEGEKVMDDRLRGLGYLS